MLHMKITHLDFEEVANLDSEIGFLRAGEAVAEVLRELTDDSDLRCPFFEGGRDAETEP